MYGDQFGGISITAIYKREQDKLANEFLVDKAQAKPILPGEPVMITEEGTIKSYDGTGKYIGINLLNGAAPGELTTVSLLAGHAILYAESVDTFNAGDPVTISRLDGVTEDNDETKLAYYNHLAATKASAGNYVAISLDKVTQAKTAEVRVLVLDSVATIA